MCMSSPPKVKPIAMAPTASPEIIDNVALTEKDDMLRKRRKAYSRQNTIMAGGLIGGVGSGAPAGAPKTATGS